MKYSWEDCATYCETLYDSEVRWNNRSFECPNCGDQIYEEDWQNIQNWMNCPKCDAILI